jgi:hypothetical protein
MREVAQKLVNTPLFCFQDFKLSNKDIIVILKDTLNTTSGPLPIPNPHVKVVSSNALKRHLIGSRVIDGIHNLVISSSMHKLVNSPTSDSSFTRELRTPPHLWVCYSAKALWITYRNFTLRQVWGRHSHSRSMSHLNIFSTSNGRKKGCESNCQFDSWPLKIGNRPDPGACR